MGNWKLDPDHTQAEFSAAAKAHATGDNGYVMGEHAGDRSWQLALRLIAAWRETDGTRRQGAFAHRLAEAAAEDGTAAVERAVLGLTALGNMFIELYADSAGRSVDAVLQDAAALSWDDGPHGWPGETNRPPEPHERGM